MFSSHPATNLDTVRQRDDRSVSADLQLSRLTLDSWQDYVAAHSQSTVFHHRAWLELLSEQYGLPIHIIGMLHKGTIVAGLPLIESKSVFGQRKLTSLPFTDSIRALAENEQALECFAAALRRPAPLLENFRAVLLKTDQPLVGQVHDLDLVRHELDTTGGSKKVRSGIAAAAKRNVKRAMAHELELKFSCSPDSVADYYALHVETRRRLGVPVQPRQFFKCLYEKIIARGLGHVALVLQHGAPIAGGVIFEFNRTLIYKYAASKAASRDLRPNDFLLWHLVDLAVARGYDRLDLGTSQESEHGLRRFKGKWGAVESKVIADEIRGAASRGRSRAQLLSLIGPVIRRSPAFVCRGLGELFYRFVA